MTPHEAPTPPQTTEHVEVRRGAYADSVALLQVSRSVAATDGVLAAQVAMATELNLDVLRGMRFEIPATTPDDMVVALRLAAGTSPDAGIAAVDAALAELSQRPAGGAVVVEPHRTTAAALRGAAPDAIALVSVPGPAAFLEAMDVVDAGHDVMIFSDNVSVEAELALKRAAADKNVLVMGPDCGTAVVGGVGLGFANVVTPGPVGIVAASGTGCQQVLALLDHAGIGVRHALGVGGRDLSEAVGGLATREALRRLDADPEVELILVVSKPPAAAVAAEIEAYARALATPAVFAFLGPGRPDLTAATREVVERLEGDVSGWTAAARPAEAPTPGGRVRGLFVGGTLAEEAALVVEATTSRDVDRSLAGLAGDRDAVVDFGADELTVGRAHPMIDPTLRLDHLARVLDDPTTGVVLLDVVLGHAAEPDPAAALAPAISPARVPVVVAVIGTSADPQGLSSQVAALVAAGAEVHLSNAEAARRAAELSGAGR